MSKTATTSELSVYYHTHWDREWYQPFREYQVRLAETVRRILDRLESGSLPCFTLDGQTVILEDYLELFPEDRPRVETLVRQHKLSIGPWYVMPDEFLVSGESLIRNLRKGLKTSRELGCQHFTGYLPDTFGHSGDIPLLLNGFDIPSAVIWRGFPKDQGPLFHWESRDGSRIFGYALADGYFQNLLHDPELSESEREAAFEAWLKKIETSNTGGKSSSNFALFPAGGDHLGPVPEAGIQLLRKKFPVLNETFPAEFLEALRGELAGQKSEAADLPLFTGELVDNRDTFILSGVYSSRLYLKQANRKLEHRLTRVIEPLLGISRFGCPDAAASNPVMDRMLGKAWTLLLQNHPHDSICGCSVDAVHRENEVRFAEVEQIADALQRRLEHALSLQADNDHWVVWNTGGTEFSGIVSVREFSLEPDFKTALVQQATDAIVLQENYLYDLNDVPMSHKTMTARTGWLYVENVPPLGFKIVPKSEKPSLQAISVDPKTGEVRNEYLKFKPEKDGTLSVTCLKTGREFGGLHRLVARAEQGDSYNAAPVPGSKPVSAKFTGFTVTESGPLRATIRLAYEFSKTGLTLTTKVTLEAGNPQVLFETAFVNNTPDQKIQVGFPATEKIRTVHAESHFGIEERGYDPDFDLAAAMPAPAWKELLPNSGPIQRFVRVQDQLFITEGLSEYEVFQNVFSLTLHRGFGSLSSGATGVRGAQAGPPFETPEGQCLGRPVAYRYAWLPMNEGTKPYQEAERFYGVADGVQGAGGESDSRASSLFRLSNPDVVVSALYPTSAGLILRLINTVGRVVDVELQSLSPLLGRARMFETDFADAPLGESLESLSGGRQLSGEDLKTLASLTFSPWQVKTFLFQVQ